MLFLQNSLCKHFFYSPPYRGKILLKASRAVFLLFGKFSFKIHIWGNGPHIWVCKENSQRSSVTICDGSMLLICATMGIHLYRSTDCSAFNGSKIPSQFWEVHFASLHLRVSIPSGAGLPASSGNSILPFRTNNLNCSLHSMHWFRGMFLAPKTCISKGDFVLMQICWYSQGLHCSVWISRGKQ